ncbi:MAG: transposase, partial [Corynebacterium sp.]|nr:transposase [Corynebacterium sp.]
TIVMAAMATGHILVQASGLSLKRLVRTLSKYCSFAIKVAGQTVHAQSPAPDDAQTIIDSLPQPSD